MGWSEGRRVGLRVGSSVGVRVGSRVVNLVGLDVVGRRVGIEVREVGLRVSVGWDVEFSTCKRVGSGVGYGEGSSVG